MQKYTSTGVDVNCDKHTIKLSFVCFIYYYFEKKDQSKHQRTHLLIWKPQCNMQDIGSAVKIGMAILIIKK